MTGHFKATRKLVADLPSTGPTDPIEFYKRPLVGWLYRERLNRGLALLPAGRVGRALEIGYGAGAVLLTLAPAIEELHGIDLDAKPEPVRALLASRGYTADLRQGSVLELPYADGFFDLLVSFSVFEHLRDYRLALSEAARVLKPGGSFLLGMPAVNKLMDAGFFMIGFRGINDHHVTTPRDVQAAFAEQGFAVSAERHLDFPPVPLGMRLYNNWLLRKR